MAQSAALPPAEAGDSRHQGIPRGGSFPDLSRSLRAAAIDRDGSAADPIAPVLMECHQCGAEVPPPWMVCGFCGADQEDIGYSAARLDAAGLDEVLP